VLPATILRCHGSPAARLATIARFWALVWAGNLAGAFLVGYAIHLGLHYPPYVGRLLDQVVARKMAYRAIGGAGGWWQVVLSGMLANWLVGMAAFFAVMGRPRPALGCRAPSRSGPCPRPARTSPRRSGPSRLSRARCARAGTRSSAPGPTGPSGRPPAPRTRRRSAAAPAAAGPRPFRPAPRAPPCSRRSRSANPGRQHGNCAEDRPTRAAAPPGRIHHSIPSQPAAT
jgi:hypothetical protein